jgi:hypothetical protein
MSLTGPLDRPLVRVEADSRLQTMGNFPGPSVTRPVRHVTRRRVLSGLAATFPKTPGSQSSDGITIPVKGSARERNGD